MSDGKVQIDVDLDKAKAMQGVNDINKQVGSMAKNISATMKNAGKSMTKYVTTPILGMAAGMGKAAMDLEATEAKYNTVFKGMTKQSDAFIKEFQKLTPATKAEARSMASGIQDLLIPMGVAREDATGMTEEFMHVSGALANFNSGTHTAQDVTNAMSSALTGQYDSLKSLGIQLDATTVKEKAVEMGLASSTDEVNKSMQAQVLMKEVYAQSGDALDAYTESNLDAKTKMGLLKTEIIDVAAEFGTAMLPAISSVIDVFRDAISWLNNLSEEQRKLVGMIGMVAAAIGPLLLAASFMIEKFLVIKGAIGGLLAGFKAAGGIFGIFKGLLVALFSPIGLVVGVIGVLAGAFMYLYENCAYFNDIVGELITAFKALMDGTGSFREVFEIASLVIEEFVLSLAHLIPQMIEKGTQMAIGFLQGLDQLRQELLWKGVEFIVSLTQGINQALPGLVTKAIEIMNSLLVSFQQILPQLLTFGQNLLIHLMNGLRVVVPQLIEMGINILLGLIDTFLGFLPTLMETGKKFLRQVIQGLIATLPQLVEAGLSLIMRLINLFIDNLPKFIERGKQLIRSLKDGLIAMLPDLIQGGVTLMAKLLAKILEYAPILLAAGITLIWELIKGVTSLVNEAVGAINEIGAAIIREALNIDLMSAGKDIVKGLWSGISSMGGWIKGKVGGFFSGVTDKVKSVFKINSPSKVFSDEIGEMLPAGAVKGVEGKERETESKIGNSFQGVIGSSLKALKNVKMPDVGAKAVASLPIPQSQSGNDNSGSFEQMLEYLRIIAAKENMMVLDDGTIVSKNMSRIDQGLAENTDLNKGRWDQ